MKIDKGLVQARRTPGWFYPALFGLALLFLLPLAWMVSTAFKPAEMIYPSPPQWLPSRVTLENFQKAWKLLDVPQLFANSFFVTTLTVLGSLISSPLVG